LFILIKMEKIKIIFSVVGVLITIAFFILFIYYGITQAAENRELSCREIIEKLPNMKIINLPSKCLINIQKL